MQDSGLKVSLIAAISAADRGLGNGGQLLWHIPDDLKRFKEVTNGHPVIMGRKTWESIPEKYRPLPGRTNIVVTRQAEYVAEGAEVCGSLESALEKGRAAEGGAELFIIGGGELYREALPFATKLYLTLIDDQQPADTFFPPYDHDFTKKTFEESRELNGLHYTWLDLERA